jgi:hypothetical protein
MNTEKILYTLVLRTESLPKPERHALAIWQGFLSVTDVTVLVER